MTNAAAASPAPDTLPPPPPPPPLRPPLRRSATQSVLGGVCGGLAEHTGIDALLWRVGLVVLTLAGGAGVLLYAALWLLLPEPDGRPGPVRRYLDRHPDDAWRGVLIGVVGVFAALLLFGLVVTEAGGFLGLLVLLGVGFLGYLYLTRDRAPSALHAAGPVTTTPPAAVTDAPVAAGAPGAVPATGARSWPTLPRRAPRPPRPKSRLGLLTFSALLLVWGVLAVVDQASTLDPTPTHYLAVGLGVVGAGLLVGTFLGRSRGLILLGLPILLLLIPVSAFSLDPRDGVDGQRFAPRTVADIQPAYQLGIGGLSLDLTGVDFTGEDVTTRLNLTGGYVEVDVPRTVDVTVRSDVRGGGTEIFFASQSGSDLVSEVTDLGPDGAGGGRLELIVDINLGYLEVDRVN